MNLPMPVEKGTQITLSYFATDVRGLVEDAIIFQDCTKKGSPIYQSMFIRLEDSALATNLVNGLLWMLFDTEGNGVSTPYVFIKYLDAPPKPSSVNLARELAHYQTRAEKLEQFVRVVRDLPYAIHDLEGWLMAIKQRATELLPHPQVEQGNDHANQ